MASCHRARALLPRVRRPWNPAGGNPATTIESAGEAEVSAPVRAQEVASVSGGQDVQSGISGNPPVFEFTAERVGTLFGEFYGYDPVVWPEEFQQGLLEAFLTGPSQYAGSAPNLL